MANNRLILVYRPTGEAVVIGKRMGAGWYISDPDDLGRRLGKFYDRASVAGLDRQDDFQLVIEDADGAPALSDDWIWAQVQPPRVVMKQ